MSNLYCDDFSAVLFFLYIFYLNLIIGFALKTAAMSGIILGGTALIVPAIGFGAAGVTAGSLAAAYQSAFLGGTIASGSIFATLQSIGAVGLSAAANTAVVAGSAAASGIHTICKKDKKDSK